MPKAREIWQTILQSGPANNGNLWSEYFFLERFDFVLRIIYYTYIKL